MEEIKTYAMNLSIRRSLSFSLSTDFQTHSYKQYSTVIVCFSFTNAYKSTNTGGKRKHINRCTVYGYFENIFKYSSLTPLQVI